MSWLASHVVLMLIYAFLAGAFFSLLWKTDARDRLRIFAIVFFGMIAGGLAVVWVMYPFPG